MGAWGLVGLAGAAVARATRSSRPELGRIPLAAACAAAGLLYGAVMNFSLWATFSGDHSLDKLALFFSTSLMEPRSRAVSRRNDARL